MLQKQSYTQNRITGHQQSLDNIYKDKFMHIKNNIT